MKDKIEILVVDDELEMRNLLDKILKRDGYKVTLAENGQTALQCLKDKKFDIVISDIKMPEMNGFELLKSIKEEKPDVGVIMMTGFGDAFTVKDAMILGADEYITKPFKAHEISLILERTCLRKSMQNQQ
ncbi:MAG: response regulator [candidate division Zixibacteria bacterium]|nr:response regulator [candidate division Zixibacteria bacterium]